jgi:peptidoglycan hydrolase-like protein with peptidoglycan-binding domain
MSGIDPTPATPPDADVANVDVPGGAPAAPTPTYDLPAPFSGSPAFAAIRDEGASLASGARGDAVRILQGALVETGLLSGAAAADGIYGRMTAGAVAALQKRSGLPPTGTLDCATLGALVAASAAAAPGAADADAVRGLFAAGKRGAALDRAMQMTEDLIDNAMGGRWGVLADADAASVARFRSFLADLGPRLTDLARAAAKDAAAVPARTSDGIPRRIPAEQLAALVHAYGTPEDAARWNAGAPKTPAGDYGLSGG